MDTYPLEERIIGLLRDQCANRLKHRFIFNENNGLFACETDEQAGIVDLTEDDACTFKAEPVYAATVKEIVAKVAAASGKIYREISANGGQPLVTLLSLSTGLPANDSEQADLQQTIAGMASYGNTFGIPVTGGDMRFNDSVCQDITANLFTVGLIDKGERPCSSCRCEGSPVYLVGAPDTGEEQILSSAFISKSLYELICDLNDESAIVAVQNIDRGKTEVSCSLEQIAVACANMVANGINGIELNTDLFDGMQTLMDSVSNKLIMILKSECGKKLEKACHKWNMRCMQLGVVTADHKLLIKEGQTPVVDLPASVLSTFYGALPEIDLLGLSDPVVFENQKDLPDLKDPAGLSIPEEHKDVAKFMMTCPNLQSQQWIFEQFDSTVGTNHLSTNFISDASVMQIKGSRYALAVSFCQSATNIEKYPESVNLAVAESLRRAVCSGGAPRTLTGCLHYNGDIDEKILHTVNQHIALFCKKMGISSSGINMNRTVTDGNPTIRNLSAGVIAFLNDKHQQMTMSFKAKGDMIYMLGKSVNCLNSSEYIRNYHGIKDTPPQQIDLDVEVKLLQVAQKLIARQLVKSAHSVSKGGLFMALLESAMVRSFGFDVTVDAEIHKDAFLFGESPSRIVVSVAMSREADFIDFMMNTDVPFMTLGHVTREEIRIDDNSYGFISDYRKKYLGQ